MVSLSSGMLKLPSAPESNRGIALPTVALLVEPAEMVVHEASEDVEQVVPVNPSTQMQRQKRSGLRTFTPPLEQASFALQLCRSLFPVSVLVLVAAGAL